MVTTQKLRLREFGDPLVASAMLLPGMQTTLADALRARLDLVAAALAALGRRAAREGSSSPGVAMWRSSTASFAPSPTDSAPLGAFSRRRPLAGWGAVIRMATRWRTTCSGTPSRTRRQFCLDIAAVHDGGASALLGYKKVRRGRGGDGQKAHAARLKDGDASLPCGRPRSNAPPTALPRWRRLRCSASALWLRPQTEHRPQPPAARASAAWHLQVAGL